MRYARGEKNPPQAYEVFIWIRIWLRDTYKEIERLGDLNARGANDYAILVGQELAGYACALDEWMSSKGTPPKDWDRKEKNE